MTDLERRPNLANKDSASENGCAGLPIDALAVAAPAKRVGAPLAEKYLLEGKLADGETSLLSELSQQGKDDQLRFGLGILQFLGAVERLSQDLHRYGLREFSAMAIPILSLPVPSNPAPETLSYDKARAIAETLLRNLTRAEATLALISDSNVKLPLHFGMIRLDLDGDGHAGEDETLWRLYAGVVRNGDVTAQQAQQFYITFDRGDVHWLRGYCHLLSAICQIYLAHDTREMFECVAHVFFPKVKSPYGFLSKGRHVRSLGHDNLDLTDLIALIHLIRWPVVEQARMAEALHHLEATVAQSKESWSWIMAETDDDREWIPNPRQTGVIPNVRVTDEMVSSWLELMSQADKILKGKLLIAFWRGDDGRGVNLRKVFLEPRTLDLVLWLQGPGAVPFLQTGETTKIETWRRLQDAFGSQFPGFALWFN